MVDACSLYFLYFCQIRKLKMFADRFSHSERVDISAECRTQCDSPSSQDESTQSDWYVFALVYLFFQLEINISLWRIYCCEHVFCCRRRRHSLPTLLLFLVWSTTKVLQ